MRRDRVHPEKLPNFAVADVTSQLACGVLSLGAERGLAEAVRSLLEQVPQAELVVVNSGGGDPRAKLRSSGLDVPVVDVDRRLLPGAARNVAIDHTTAPFIAFLAADCVAQPGWVAGRLRAHNAGAAAVASVMTVERSATRSQCAAHLLLHHRRTPDTPPGQRLFYGLSYQRRLFDRYGRFREDLRQGEDTDFNERLGRGDVVAWAPDVRTVHRHPAGPGQLLRDQYVRGRRRALALAELAPARARRTLLGHGAANVRQALRQARRASSPEERDLLMRSRALLVPAALAYVTGGLVALRGRRSPAPDRSAGGADRSRR
jgi:glycosyltransferase involved in cell wall biosynthesis